MLHLQNISKIYTLKHQTVQALKDVSISFDDHGFVSILGPSGCGKTTLLNIIGGIDHYTSGDLSIDGLSTKQFKDRDFDAYRNHYIGFVFQNYHLIKHLNILDNVALSLSLSGVSKEIRIQKAKKALQQVGLEDKLYNRPNELSGGQQQRVAIARALVNNPSVILADEPTGAIDSKTAHPIMELLKEISKDRLVIMVTHNPELANTYSDRIVEFLDGVIIKDSNPVTLKSKEAIKTVKKSSMSYLTALKLSFKNLLTKKLRTLIIAFSGSIGIIGIALILSISHGFGLYIQTVQQDLLSSVPITIEEQTLILPDFIPTGPPIFTDNNNAPLFPEAPFIYPFTPTPRVSNYTHFNVLTDDYMTYFNDMNETLYSDITFNYRVEPLLVLSSEDSFRRVSASSIRLEVLKTDDQTLLESQYDVLAGRYPDDTQIEMVIVVSNRNQLRDFIVNNLGFDDEEIPFESLLNLSLKLVHSGIYYERMDSGYFRGNPELSYQHNEAVDIKIVGILRAKEGVETPLLSEGFGFTSPGYNYVLESSKNAPIIEAFKVSLIEGGTEGPFNSVYNEGMYQRRSDVINEMARLGNEQFPSRITIYPKDFESKSKIVEYLNAYNSQFSDDETYLKIIYTDFTQTFTSYLGQIVSNITLLLVGLSSISLIVSSILIGIITYVSVIERTKEIGVLRALGARKKDITRVFNAETIIVGFLAGSLGIIITVILNPIVNLVIERFADIKQLSVLPLSTALYLIILSVALTLIAGFIPAKIASRKDPVVALRTE
jgi:putative ABC transport system permease protein